MWKQFLCWDFWPFSPNIHAKRTAGNILMFCSFSSFCSRLVLSEGPLVLFYVLLPRTKRIICEAQVIVFQFKRDLIFFLFLHFNSHYLAGYFLSRLIFRTKDKGTLCEFWRKAKKRTISYIYFYSNFNVLFLRQLYWLKWKCIYFRWLNV